MKISSALRILAAAVAAELAASNPSVLMVLTSHSELGDTKAKTGWYLPEAAHPFAVFKKAGVEMTWASPKGGEAPLDPSSVKAWTKDKESMDFMHHEDCWKHTEKLSDVNARDYDAVFVVGGYGVMWDLVGNKQLEQIAAGIYEDGGVVSAVCHGPAALVGVKLDDGKSLVEGKEVACFSNAEEDVLKRRKVVPTTCEDAFGKAKAKYTKGKPWGDHVAVAGRLVTGQNPMSAKSTAAAVVKALKEDEESRKFEVGITSNKGDDKKKDSFIDTLEKDESGENRKSSLLVGLGFAGGAVVVGVGFFARRIMGETRAFTQLSTTNDDDEEQLISLEEFVE